MYLCNKLVYTLLYYFVQEASH